MKLRNRIDRLEEAVKPQGEDMGSRLRKALEGEDDFSLSLRGLDEDEKAKRIKERDEELDEWVRRFRGKGKT